YEAWSANAGASFGANAQVNDDRALAPQLSPNLVANAGKIQIAWADYRTGGSTNYDIYTAASEDGISWSPNMKVNDDTLPNNFQMNRSIAVAAARDAFPAFDEGQSLYFDASASTDNVGVTSYRWDFGDSSSASTAAASHVYARPGAYTASLTVMDAAGNSATSTFSVTVRAVSPKASDLLGM